MAQRLPAAKGDCLRVSHSLAGALFLVLSDTMSSRSACSKQVVFAMRAWFDLAVHSGTSQDRCVLRVQAFSQRANARWT